MSRTHKLGTTSPNLEALQNFRYTPLQAIGNLVVAPAVTDEEIAQRQAREAQRKADKAKAKADAKAAQAARAKPRLPQPRMVIPPTPEAIALVARQQRSKAEQRSAAKAAAPIPEEILKKGLEADLAEEAKRREAEAAEAKLRADAYKKDVFATALGIGNRNIPLEAKVLLLNEIGFHFEENARNGRDAVYSHATSQVTFFLRGGAIGQNGTARAHKPRGVELLSKVEIAKRQAVNAALRAKGRIDRKTPKVKTPKVDKKAKKDDDKKSKRGGKGK